MFSAGVLAVLLWAAVTDHYAVAQERTVAVEGRVVNGTVGGDSVNGLTVVLHLNDGASFEERTTDTSEDGTFRFTNIVPSEAVSYGVSVQRLGVVYGTGVDLSNGPPEPITLTVYDAASDESMLAIGSASLLVSAVEQASETIWVLEIVQVVNDTDVAYVPGPSPMSLLRFGLPPGALDLQVDTSLLGADVLQVDRGFALTAGVPPGSHDVMFAYRFPYRGTEATFEKTLRYGAQSVRVLAASGLVNITVEGLGEPGLVAIGEHEYTVYEAAGLPRGARLNLSLTDLPEASFGERLASRLRQVPLQYTAPAGLGIMMALVVGAVLWRRRGRVPAAQPAPAPSETNFG